jgi:arginine utilization regulatory protein
VRIIATINADPAQEISAGRLRKDLYYRISVIHINLPPLRERREDIPMLIGHFINHYNKILSKDIWYVSEDVEKELVSYRWPGNVRELKNYIEGAMNMVTSGHVINREHFTPNVHANLFKYSNAEQLDYDIGMGLDETLESIEKRILINTLGKCGGNISKCSQMLNIKRQTLQHKLKKYNINCK